MKSRSGAGPIAMLAITIWSCSGTGNGTKTQAPEVTPTPWNLDITAGLTMKELRAILDGDLAVPLRGQGWQCFEHTDNGRTVCRRKKDRCEVLRKRMMDRERPVTECIFHARAYCVRGKERTDGFELAFCSTTEPQCMEERKTFDKDPRLLFVSRCEELP